MAFTIHAHSNGGGGCRWLNHFWIILLPSSASFPCLFSPSLLSLNSHSSLCLYSSGVSLLGLSTFGPSISPHGKPGSGQGALWVAPAHGPLAGQEDKRGSSFPASLLGKKQQTSRTSNGPRQPPAPQRHLTLSCTLRTAHPSHPGDAPPMQHLPIYYTSEPRIFPSSCLIRKGQNYTWWRLIRPICARLRCHLVCRIWKQTHNPSLYESDSSCINWLLYGIHACSAGN